MRRGQALYFIICPVHGPVGALFLCRLWHVVQGAAAGAADPYVAGHVADVPYHSPPAPDMARLPGRRGRGVSSEKHVLTC